MSSKLSVKDFEAEVRNGVQQICKDKKWNYDDNRKRGFAFQLWVARLMMEADRGLQGDAESALLYTDDLKADLVLEDPDRRHLIVVQCKYVSLKDNPPIPETEVNDF